MNDLRNWQRKALTAVLESHAAGVTDFLLVACPAAGKTRLAIAVAQSLPEYRIMHVVPSDSLVKQAIANYADAGIELVDFRECDGEEPQDTSGIVVTYQSMVTRSPILRRLCRKPTLVILDEIHHSGDSKAWGDATLDGCGGASFRLLMSGTPWRSDGMAIPFVEYDDSGQLMPDFDYSIGSAWSDDPSPIRHVEFPFVDAQSRYIMEGETRESKLSEVEHGGHDFAATLRNAHYGDWLDYALQLAIRDLDDRRRVRPNAGGIIWARDMRHAEYVASKIQTLSGRKPEIVSADVKDSGSIIEAFRRSLDPWIVNIQILGEGIDLPRCEVGVHAGKTFETRWLTQAAFRLLRKTHVNDAARAAFYVPHVGPAVAWVAELEAIQHIALKDKREPDRPLGPREPSEPFRVIDLGSKDAELSFMAGRDGAVPGDALEAMMRAMPDGAKEYTAELYRRGFRPPEQSEAAPTFNMSSKSAAPARRKQLRDEVHALAKKLAYLKGGDYASVNTTLAKRASGKSRGNWTIADFEEALSWLQDQIQLIAK